jgi:hypothetical protein
MLTLHLRTARAVQLLRRMLAGIIAEHFCSSPDADGVWDIMPSSAAPKGREVYVCPECGQFMMRRPETISAA